MSARDEGEQCEPEERATADAPARSAVDLLHDLQSCQAELAMQRESLRQTQLALEEARARYLEFFEFYEFAPVGYLVLGRDSLIEAVNLSGAALLRRDRQKLLQSRFSELVAPEDLDRWRRHFLRVAQFETRQTCDLALRCGEGSVLYAQVDCLRTALTENGPVLNVTLTDITVRKRFEEGLRDSENRFSLFMKHLPAAVYVKDAQGRHVFTNPALENMLGASGADLLGKANSDLGPPELAQKISENDAQVFASGALLITEEDALLGGECRHFLTHKFLLGNASDSPQLAGISLDITDRKQAEQKRLDYVSEQRDTLVREVHHHIKNHLQGLTGLLRQHAQEQPALMPVVDKMAGQISAIAVVHGLHGRHPGAPVCLRDMLAEIAVFTGAGRVLLEADPPSAECGCGRALAETEAVPLALIINELLSNALRHGDGRADTPVRVSLRCADGGSRLTIANAGALAPDLDFAAGVGLGSGLTLLRSLLPQRGAVLTIANVPARGVEARLSLSYPVVSDDPGAAVTS
jgi:PAS domain S-box-containing protein